MTPRNDSLARIIIYFCLISFLIIALITISGCAPSKSKTGKDKGHVPVLNNVIFFNERGYASIYIETIEYLDIWIDVTDRDLDINNLILYTYYPSNSESPYFGPVYWGLSSQPTINDVHFLFLDTGNRGPAGWWRFEFQIEDAKGNESNIFRVYIYATE